MSEPKHISGPVAAALQRAAIDWFCCCFKREPKSDVELWWAWNYFLDPLPALTESP